VPPQRNPAYQLNVPPGPLRLTRGRGTRPTGIGFC